MSLEDDAREVVIFELSDGVDTISKLCQLELRLAIFTMHRFKKGKICTSKKNCVPSLVRKIVALAGLIHGTEDRDIVSVLLAAENFESAFPHIYALHKRARFVSKAIGGTPPTPLPNTFWAQLVPPAEDPTQRPKAVAFQVTPAIANIDGLKKAVKAEVPEKLVGIASIDLKVYAHDAAAGGWVEVTKASAPLTPNTEDTAYHVVVGS